MPGNLDGYQLAHMTRERFPNAALMVVSGHLFPRGGQMPEGAVFVSKPYDAEAVLSRMYELIES
jgi:hypothetical protein